jgi:outer membrane protein assembly factor BamB
MRNAIATGFLLAAGFVGGVFASRASAAEPAGGDPSSSRVTRDSDAASWPQWRGPSRNGVAPASPKLADSWPKDGPRQVWKTGWIPGCRSGGGLAQPVVADDKVFIYTSWRHPPGGGDGADGYVPITPEILRDWGYVPGMSKELADKIEAARISPKKPKVVQHFPDLLNIGMPEKEQVEKALVRIKRSPGLEAYIKDFLATLDPKDAEKYESYVQRRFCINGGANAAPNWDQLQRIRALEGKAYKVDIEFEQAMGQLGACSEGGSGSAWDRASTVVDTMLCLDAATGKEIWRKEMPFDRDWGKFGSGNLGPMSTPAIWGGKCYVTGLMGLYCLSTKDGALLWQKKGCGVHSSVAVDDGVVYGCIGTQPLSAFDAETGKLLWRCPGVESTTASPALWKSGGKTYVICAWWCVDGQTGRLLWRGNDWNIGYGITPVVVGDTVIICSGAYKLTPEKPELLWKMPPNANDPASSPLVYDGYLYWFWSWYGGDIWTCLDLKTGELKWKMHSKVPASCAASSPVVVDGKIIHPIGNGHDWYRYQVEMLRATPEKYDLLGVFDPGATAFSSPAVADGKLYLRLWDGVACYDLTK